MALSPEKIASIRRRYGATPLTAMSIDPGWYRENVGEDLLDSLVTLDPEPWAEFVPRRVTEDELRDINAWQLSAVHELPEAAEMYETAAGWRWFAFDAQGLRILDRADGPLRLSEADRYFTEAHHGNRFLIEEEDEWDWDGWYWVLSTTWNRLEKNARKRAAAAAVDYQTDLAAGTVVYEWDPEPDGTQWWVMKIPTADALRIDGTVMGHCTADPRQGHMEDLESGFANFFSLRCQQPGEPGVRVSMTKVVGTKKWPHKYGQSPGKEFEQAGIESREKNNDVPGFNSEGSSRDARRSGEYLLSFFVGNNIRVSEEMFPFIVEEMGKLKDPSFRKAEMVDVMNESISAGPRVFRIAQDAAKKILSARGPRPRRNPEPDPDVLAAVERIMERPAFGEQQ